ncbi:MAG: stage III sporulation protein AG [Lachnospiraceae bacterium]|jgi:stage III sporulation protein AG|nr:stage III sporulation protein AG [Lachnospiraceae bacterium]
MDWRKKLCGLPGRMTKEGWIVLLCLGLIMMIVAMPLSGKNGGGEKMGKAGMNGGNLDKTGVGREGNGEDAQDNSLEASLAKVLAEKTGSADLAGLSKAGGQEGAGGDDSLASYEAVLENRVKEVLKKVEGVGAVDVLIVLKSSEERVYRTDGKHSQSSTKEVDSAGGSREVTEQQEEVNTVLSSDGGSLSGSGGSGALLEKELRPELSGIIISAQGGGSPTVKAEITEAMQALFGLPAHKIKVLKRVE